MTAYQYFPRDQIHIIDADEFRDYPAKVISEIEDFLGVPKYAHARHFTRNEKGFFCINKTDGCLGPGKGRIHPNVSEVDLDKIRKYYAPELSKFFSETKINFTWSGKFRHLLH